MMARKSRLLEKGTRMPDLRESEFDRLIREYVNQIHSLNTESAKSHRFTMLLKDLFGLQPGFIEEYLTGIETYVKIRQKDRILRGRADELFGNVLIEFEVDLNARAKQDEAEAQLRKYLACLWSQEPIGQRTRYLGLATDGLRFIVYAPVLADPVKITLLPEEVILKPVEEINLSILEPAREFYFWLDRYLLRREILPPCSENIVKDFGVNSHTFQVVAQNLLTLWERIHDQSEFQVVYETWEKYLRIAYGSALADSELFIRHTYLATVAKLMAWMRLTEKSAHPSMDQIREVLEGQFFKDQGIENFLEEDFFSWIVRDVAKEEGIGVARLLLGLLRNYNLRELSEDVLKALYQELVDPKTRHDLGEYYTPDWLAARMVERVLTNQPKAYLLDPACGSGTFLYQAVHQKRKRLGDTAETLEHILDAVTGIDIHPLAVIVAKTNYLLALGDLLRKRNRISIPIYLSNAIRLPEYVTSPSFAENLSQQEARSTFRIQLPGYRIELDGQPVHLPEVLVQQPALYDQAIEAAREFALRWSGRNPQQEHFLGYLQAHHPSLAQDEDLAHALFSIAEALRGLIEARRDTIWAFVLKNAYKPLSLKGRFDVVIGNPPWLSYRYVEQRDDQEFLKDVIVQHYRLLAGRGELITQMELGSLFLLRAADLYLKTQGQIAFVLPRSIFSADQHDALRRRAFQRVPLTWTEVWDLEGVEPLFMTQACVLFGEKGHPAQESPSIAGQVLSGKLPRRNASLREAQEALAFKELRFFLNRRGKRSFWGTDVGASQVISPYRKRFFQGATIVPRSFWFVEVHPSPLGFDPNLPPLVTARRAQEQAKDAYQGLVFKGSVESRFLYVTLLSTDLLPFGHLGFRLVVLPIEPGEEGYRMITAEQARARGYLRLAEWLARAQAEWETHRGAKAKFMNIYERLDRVRGLTRQNPQATYRVLYPRSGTYLCATKVENLPCEFVYQGQSVMARGVITDFATYQFETSEEKEANYLVGILNASVIDQLLKPMQSRGQWGQRDIAKKVLDLPIPQFDTSQPAHLRLAELGKFCSERVAAWLAAGGAGRVRSIGRLRQMVRGMLSEELQEINHLVEALLKSST